MADPAIISCTEGTWTKVATNQTTGVVHILNFNPDKYLQTYRDTGGGAPTLVTEGVPFTPSLQISASAGIDVYVWPVGRDGSVRVDL